MEPAAVGTASVAVVTAAVTASVAAATAVAAQDSAEVAEVKAVGTVEELAGADVEARLVVTAAVGASCGSMPRSWTYRGRVCHSRMHRT